MAVGNVVPGRENVRLTLVRCWKCGTLYSTDQSKQIYKKPVYNSARSLGEPTTSYTQWTAYEKCPVCGNETNSDGTVIPAWKFKLIRWWRGMKRKCD